MQRSSWRCLRACAPARVPGPRRLPCPALLAVPCLRSPGSFARAHRSPEVLKKRLRKKNAPGEAAISDDYIEEVAKAYEHFFFHYTASDLLVVNTSDIDFVDRNEDLQQLLRRLSEPIHGTQYFLPLGSEAASA